MRRLPAIVIMVVLANRLMDPMLTMMLVVNNVCC